MFKLFVEPCPNCGDLPHLNRPVACVWSFCCLVCGLSGSIKSNLYRAQISWNMKVEEVKKKKLKSTPSVGEG